MKRSRSMALVMATMAPAVQAAPQPPGRIEVAEASIPQLQAALASGALTSRQLVLAYLARIAAYDQIGPSLNSIVTLNPAALAQADALDKERASKGPRGPLHGIPVLVKDNFDTQDMPTSGGALALATLQPSQDAHQVEKLRSAGAIILGPRIGFGKKAMTPHSMVLCAIGTGMLWVGWYGFNAGSALAADGVGAQAFMTTTLAAGVAAFTWGALEWILRKHASILGLCSGAVAGLVVITPAAGFVTASSAVLIGVLAGVVPFLAVVYMKSKLGYDDALDTFGVHAVGGTLGAILTGVLATADVNGNLNTNLKDIVGKTLLTEQLKAIGITLVLSLVATAILAYVIKAVIGLRPTEEEEARGLDISDHGEEGYSHNS